MVSLLHRATINEGVAVHDVSRNTPPNVQSVTAVLYNNAKHLLTSYPPNAQFLAYVNSRSRSRLSLCNARAPSTLLSRWKFSAFFYAIWYLGHPLTPTENFTEIVPGEPLRRPGRSAAMVYGSSAYVHPSGSCDLDTDCLT